jgi:3-methyladenine DNA glycosylase/8-oxoguanine DNA glycosylase
MALVHDFESGKVTAAKIAAASDREAAQILLGLKGIGDWCAGSVLVHFLKRADIMLYGDITIRNYLNDLYEINHNDTSETMLDSAADFPDDRENRNRMDALAKQNGWYPYRTIVGMLMYHLQQEQLFLL